MPRREDDDTSLSSRLAGTEAELDAVKESIAGIWSRLDDIGKLIRSLATDIANQQRANWPVLLTGLGVVVSIGALLYSFHGQEIARIESRINVHDSKLEPDAYNRGRVDQSRDDFEKALGELKTWVKEVSDRGLKADIELDNRLQREMRDVSAIVDTKVDALDRRLQSEIAGNVAQRNAQFAAMGKTLDQWVDFERQASGVHADHEARISALESHKGLEK